MSTPEEIKAAMGHVMQLVSGRWVAQCVGVAATLRFADFIGDSAMSAAELAAAAGTHPDATGRVMRALIAVGVFTFEDGKFSNNNTSRMLGSTGPSLRGLARMFTMETAWDAMSHLEHSVRTGESAFEHKFGKKCWELWDTERKEDGAVFNDAMTALSNADGPAIAQAIKAELGLTKERMCDIGGSKGILLSTILEAHEGMTGVVLDLEYVVKDCVSKGRLEFQAGDMFKEVPVADVYILKYIFHDWDNAANVKMLENMKRANGSARVLVCENLVTEKPEDNFATFLDIEMLVVTTNGRERTQAEFAALFQAGGYELERVLATSSGVKVIVAKPL